MGRGGFKVEVNVAVFEWACRRSGQSKQALVKRFPRLDEWLRGADQPTLSQLERFAQATGVPIGCFFLPEPPRETLPIPDFRTTAGKRPREPSGNLLDTVYLCQQRQDWYREYAAANGEPPVEFVGSASLNDDVVDVARHMRSVLRFDVQERRQLRSWRDAFRRFVEHADAAGVLVMVSGVVGSNTRRKLDPDEFRGFALSDPLAPLVFVNGADARAAQMFTLAHELAHLWLGQSSLSDVRPDTAFAIERWCNAVAAEFLVPREHLPQSLKESELDRAALRRLARDFKVSTLVILRRLYDAGLLTRDRFRAEYEAELARAARTRKDGGGDFYHAVTMRVGRRFATALLSAVWEGRASFSEARRLLSVGSVETLRRLRESLERDVGEGPEVGG